jgi:hypothetical protein
MASDLEQDPVHLVEFGEGGIGQSHLRDGWAPIGINWTWTLGRRSVIDLPPVNADTNYVLKIRIAGVLLDTAQRIVATVNEAAVGMVLCRGPATFEFFVPTRAFEGHDRVEVALRLPDARRPIDLERGTDRRFLALRVAKLELQPLTTKPLRQRPLPQAPEQDFPSTVLEQRAMLSEMTSLGANCEFGFVQRSVGAEPVSLFRWANLTLNRLVTGLENKFDGLSARGALDIQVNEDGEFVVEDKVYGFRHHTFAFATQGGSLDRVQRTEYVRVGVLCKTMLEDLRECKKLFVFHDGGASDLDKIRRLVRALNDYGKNTLLWIVPAASQAQIGLTHLLEPGLIQGHVSGFHALPIGPNSPYMRSWLAVACRAHQIWTKSREAGINSRAGTPA